MFHLADRIAFCFDDVIFRESKAFEQLRKAFGIGYMG